MKILLKLLIRSLFYLATCLSISYAQVTLVVDAIPAHTPAGDQVYVAGNFNNWNPGDTSFILSPNGQGQFVLTLTGSLPDPMEYKFTRGGWPTVEGNANGNVRPNRTYSPTAGDTVFHQVLSWEDLGSGSGTANSEVQIYDPAFFMPQFNRNRRIWLYLPPDYATSGKNYPVLYMHDGQNLFDANTSFSGEWKVDESLTSLHQQGDYGAIVVGIDNGGGARIDEYTPWAHPMHGGGDGDAYINFIIQTLKPHIDSTFRTLPGPATTGLIGSSLGGLISFYGGIKHQDVFGKLGVFSPSFWFSNQVYTFAQAQGHQQPMRIYFLAGEQESASMVSDMQAMYNLLLNNGFSASELAFVTKADGKHSEWFWAREFPAAYQWLFGQLSLDIEVEKYPQPVWAYPNPFTQKIWIESAQPAKVQLYDIQGSKVATWRISSSDSLDLSGFPRGLYMLQMKNKAGSFQQRVVKW